MKRITAILIIMLTSLACFSQSDLKGKELTKATDVTAALESGIGLLFGAGKMEGEIEKVEVTDENHKEVKLKITFSGFEGNWLKANLLAPDKRTLEAISSSAAAFPVGSNEIELTLAKDRESDTDVESTYLKLLVTKQEKDFTGLVDYYLLQKKWRSSGLSNEAPVYSFINESLVININPVPIGVAAQLNEYQIIELLPLENRFPVTPEKPQPRPTNTIDLLPLENRFSVTPQDKLQPKRTNTIKLHPDTCCVFYTMSFSHSPGDHLPIPSNIIDLDPDTCCLFYETDSIKRTPMITTGQMVPHVKPYGTETPLPTTPANPNIDRKNLRINRRAIPDEAPTVSTPEIQRIDRDRLTDRPGITTTPFRPTQEQISKGAKGPGNMAITLWDEIRSDPEVNFDSSQGYKITDIHLEIFPDENENSGYFYYLPASYGLQWDRESSYQLKMLYGSATDGAGETMVNMFLTITPSVSSAERNLVEALVQDYAKRNGKPFEKLHPLPLKEAPKADISNVLMQYGVAEDKIFTTATNLFDPIQISWSIPSGNAEDLMAALKEIDIKGSLSLNPYGTLTPLRIRINISLKDDRTLGRIILRENVWRNQLLKNEMPFPIRLKYIHALFLNQEDSGKTTPYIYSWDLGNQDVPVLASVNFNAESIPLMVDRGAQRIWVEYSVPDCPECMDKIFDELISGR